MPAAPGTGSALPESPATSDPTAPPALVTVDVRRVPARRLPADLRAFAYQGAARLVAIRRTKETGWYAEELFARFGVVRADGSLDGRDPLT